MKRAAIAVAGLAVLLAALVAAQLLRGPAERDARPVADNLPWQVELLPGGESKVFGLRPGTSRLDEARARFGPDLQLAVIGTPNRPPALEAYYERVTLGFITGRLILTAELPAHELDVMARRAAKTTPLPSGAWRAMLVADDVASAMRAPVTAISFIPSIDLDAATVEQRFGPPAERLTGGDGTTHLLYPAIGLDVVLDDKGKEVLQYVAPKDFARLREPLRSARS